MTIAQIRREASPFLSLNELNTLIQQLSRIQKTDHLKKIKIAIGANASLNYLKEGLEFYLRLADLDAEIYLCEFGTFAAQAQVPSSDLYRFGADIIWNFSTIHDFKESPEKEIARLQGLWRVLKKNSAAHILQNNLDLPVSRVFGHLDSEHGLSAAVQDLNRRLTHEKPVGVTIFDLEWLSSLYGKAAWEAKRFWFFGKYPFAVDATPLVAHSAAQLIAGLNGSAKKCLVLDLDNTLWGGVLAEDGLNGISLGPDEPVGEAFVDFQNYLLALKQRGIVLAVASKNDAAVIEKMFEHPHMKLRREDFAAFFVNWNNKAENIRQIADVCDLRLDSIVFVDDNPFERELVRQFLPEVTVPEMPEDPAEYTSVLDQGRYFETGSFSEEDGQRAQMYAENAKRRQLKAEISNIDEYLKSLDMRMEARFVDAETLKRSVQLINKTNQFNLSGEKMGESQAEEWLSKNSSGGRAYRLTDKFGDNGWISVVAYHLTDSEMILDHWVMSCRVLMRKVEDFVHRDLIEIARSRGIKKIKGRWKQTGKNSLVKEHYRQLGYRLVSDSGTETIWEFDLTTERIPKDSLPIAG
jgi:FkbH-like protein